MSLSPRQAADLSMVNRIVQSLNRAVDVQGALNAALPELVRLMGLQTGWIFLRDEAAQDKWAGRGYRLAAHHNLPPAMAPEAPGAWNRGCDCQGLCDKGRLLEAYNEVACSRLGAVEGERFDLTVHASVPLQAGEETLGILNVAAANWQAFTPQALALLTNVGHQMGAALARAQLYDLLRERGLLQQRALLELSNLLLGRLDLDDLLQTLADEVCRLLPVDACAVLLPDDDPQYLLFRAATGWRHDPVAAGRRLPADDRSGSGWVMRTRRPKVIRQIDAEPLPHMMAWLEAEAFQGAALIPLLTDEAAVGALVVDTRQALDLDDNDLRFLQLLANQAALAIQTARAREVELAQRQLEQDLELSRQIQLSMLPPCLPEVVGWQMAAHYAAARQVGGDFYDVFGLTPQPDHYGLVVADVSGKGIAAALFMAVSRTTIRHMALVAASPQMVLQQANERLGQDNPASMFLSAFYARLDAQSGRLLYANAGHNRPLWWQAARRRVVELSGGGTVLGILPAIPLEEREVQLAPDDVVVVYTDGITEAMDPAGREYGAARLQAVLAARADQTAESIAQDIVADVHEFMAGAEAADDLTLLILKRDVAADRPA